MLSGMSRRTTLLSASLAAAGAVGAAVAVGAGLDGFGAREDEVDARLPGDELHGPGAIVRTRAVAIDAPPAEVWPWLVQHLVGVFDAGGLRMVWTFVLLDLGDSTRLLVRTAFGGSSAAVRAARRVLLDPGHAVMEVVQLRRIKQRAESRVEEW